MNVTTGKGTKVHTLDATLTATEATVCGIRPRESGRFGLKVTDAPADCSRCLANPERAERRDDATGLRPECTEAEQMAHYAKVIVADQAQRDEDAKTAGLSVAEKIAAEDAGTALVPAVRLSAPMQRGMWQLVNGETWSGSRVPAELRAARVTANTWVALIARDMVTPETADTDWRHQLTEAGAAWVAAAMAAAEVAAYGSRQFRSYAELVAVVNPDAGNEVTTNLAGVVEAYAAWNEGQDGPLAERPTVELVRPDDTEAALALHPARRVPVTILARTFGRYTSVYLTFGPNAAGLTADRFIGSYDHVARGDQAEAMWSAPNVIVVDPATVDLEALAIESGLELAADDAPGITLEQARHALMTLAPVFTPDGDEATVTRVSPATDWNQASPVPDRALVEVDGRPHWYPLAMLTAGRDLLALMVKDAGEWAAANPTMGEPLTCQYDDAPAVTIGAEDWGKPIGPLCARHTPASQLPAPARQLVAPSAYDLGTFVYAEPAPVGPVPVEIVPLTGRQAEVLRFWLSRSLYGVEGTSADATELERRGLLWLGSGPIGATRFGRRALVTYDHRAALIEYQHRAMTACTAAHRRYNDRFADVTDVASDVELDALRAGARAAEDALRVGIRMQWRAGLIGFEDMPAPFVEDDLAEAQAYDAARGPESVYVVAAAGWVWRHRIDLDGVTVFTRLLPLSAGTAHYWPAPIVCRSLHEARAMLAAIVETSVGNGGRVVTATVARRIVAGDARLDPTERELADAYTEATVANARA